MLDKIICPQCKVKTQIQFNLITKRFRCRSCNFRWEITDAEVTSIRKETAPYFEEFSPEITGDEFGSDIGDINPTARDRITLESLKARIDNLKPALRNPRDDFTARAMVLPNSKVILSFRPNEPFRPNGFALLNDHPSFWSVYSILVGVKEQIIAFDAPENRRCDSNSIPFDTVTGEYPIDLPTIKPGSQISITLGHNDDKPRRVEIMLRGMYIPTP